MLFCVDGPLQWGRNLTVAEGIILSGHLQLDPEASMGPQLDSCGRREGVALKDVAGAASMGPQLDSCGRLRTAPTSSR